MIKLLKRSSGFNHSCSLTVRRGDKSFFLGVPGCLNRSVRTSFLTRKGAPRRCFGYRVGTVARVAAGGNGACRFRFASWVFRVGRFDQLGQTERCTLSFVGEEGG